jgi:hypothetical protein
MKTPSLVLTTLFAFAVAGGAASAQTTQTLRGTVVDYLSAAGANGSAISVEPGMRGVGVDTKNAAIDTQGASQVARPLGLTVNGWLYLLAVSNDSLVSQLGDDRGRDVSVTGHPISEDGASIFVVDSVR